MPASKQYYFRPVETKIIEVSYNPVPMYRVECKVNVYSDAEMIKFSYSKDVAFDNVPYSPTWDGILSDIYTLINTAL